MREALKRASKEKGVTPSEFIRQAVEKEVVIFKEDEINFPFRDKYEQEDWKPLSEILRDIMYSFGKFADAYPEELKNFFQSVKKLWRKRVGQGKKKNKKTGR